MEVAPFARLEGGDEGVAVSFFESGLDDGEFGGEGLVVIGVVDYVVADVEDGEFLVRGRHGCGGISWNGRLDEG